MGAEYFKPFPLELYPDDFFRRLDVDELFGSGDAALEIDLGCGDGRFLQGIASQLPDKVMIPFLDDCRRRYHQGLALRDTDKALGI